MTNCKKKKNLYLLKWAFWTSCLIKDDLDFSRMNLLLSHINLIVVSSRNHQLKLVGESMMRNRTFSIKVTPHSSVINYSKKSFDFMVEKPDRHQSNHVIKVDNISNEISTPCTFRYSALRRT